MEAPIKAIRRADRRSSRRCLSILFAVGSVVVIAIVIALAVVLSKRKHRLVRSSFVILPLYSYPQGDAWNPLFDVLQARQDVSFTIILNPDSGPGSLSYPKPDYAEWAQNLTQHQNVRTIGYVRTGWASRNISAVLSEVSTYFGWATLGNGSSNIKVDGIFFDETPTAYSPDASQYLQSINQAVKDAPGIQNEKLVVHNPGAIIDPRLNDTNTDVTVVFEGSFEAYNSQKAALDALQEDRTKQAYLIHSVPTMSSSDLKRFVNSIRDHAQGLFLTDLNIIPILPLPLLSRGGPGCHRVVLGFMPCHAFTARCLFGLSTVNNMVA